MYCLLLGLLLLAIYFGNKIRRARKFSLSDQLAAANLFLGLAIAGAALVVAILSFQDAQVGGEEQLEALKAARSAIITTGSDQRQLLDKSRSALQSMLVSSRHQQELLDKSLRASESQLAILVEQRKRELEQPDVGLLLVRPDALGLMVYNLSQEKIARNVHWAVNFMMVDRRRPDGSYPAFSTVTEQVDYIRPRGGYLPSILDFHNSDSKPILKGERLFGVATITCPDCARERVYWVYWTYQESGLWMERSDGVTWFDEMPGKQPQQILTEFLNTPGTTPIKSSYK